MRLTHAASSVWRREHARWAFSWLTNKFPGLNVHLGSLIASVIPQRSDQGCCRVMTMQRGVAFFVSPFFLFHIKKVGDRNHLNVKILFYL